MADPIYATYADMPNWGINAAVLASVPGGTTTVNAQLSSVSRFMDGFFRSQYTLPILEWGDDVRECACVVAAYKVIVIRGFNPSAGGDVNLRLRYEDQMAWLRMIGLKQVTPSMTDSAPGSLPGITADGPTMSSAVQRGYSSRPVQPDGSNTDGDFIGS